MANLPQLQNDVLAILFAAGDPFEKDKLARVLDIDLDTLQKVVERINEQLASTPFVLLELDKSYQMTTREEFASVIRDALQVKNNAPLSQAAMEVLAIIAYNQPVTKAFVEQVRGVDCSGVIATLCQKRLIEEKGRLDLPGRPLLYGTTPDFLRCFSVSSLDELPQLPNKVTTENDTETGGETAVDGSASASEEPREQAAE